jgi:OOP family OmpA-OmpF porin
MAAPAPAPVETRLVLSANLVFDFDRSAAADIRPAGRDQLDKLLRRVAAEHLRVVSVKLVGHADRLNGTGNAAYNQALSERRAKTVRELLIGRGVDGRVIDASAVGDAAQVEPCRAKPRSTAELEECLLPNRRVEVELTAIARP